MRFCFLFVLVLWATSSAGLRGNAGEESAVQREWRVRTWALTADARAILDALREDDWVWRADALDSLARSLRSGAWTARQPARDVALELRAALVRSLDDEHPNVRALALDAYSSWPGRVPARALAAFERRLGDALPEARTALARALGHPRLLRSKERSVWLGALARDGDEHVALAARASLFGLGELGEAEALALLASLDPEEHSAELTAAQVVLGRNRPSRALLERLAAHWRSLTAERPAEPRVAYARCHLALCQALSFYWYQEGSGGDLVEGWLEPGEPSPARLPVLLAGAAVAGSDLTPLFFSALLSSANREDESSRISRAALLLEGALESTGPTAFARELTAASSLSDQVLILAWELLRGRVRTWNPADLSGWLGPDTAPTVRAQVALALADTLHRESDPGSAQMLVQALGDGDQRVAEIAFRALAQAPACEEWMADLHKAWRQLDGGERLKRLKLLSRERSWEPFARGLMELGRRDPGSRGVAAELLGASAWNEGVRAELESWLDWEVEALTSLHAPASSDFRTCELRAVELVRALHQSQGPSAVPALVRTAESVAEKSPEIATAVITALGQTDAGCLWLPRYLEPRAPRSQAVEASLALIAASESTDLGDPRAVRVLVRYYSACDGRLRKRVLQAMGQLRDAPSREFLAQVACSGESELEERQEAVASLASRGGDSECARALVRVAECTQVLEVLRSTVEALGRVGGEHAAQFLSALLSKVDADACEISLGSRPLVAEECSLLRGSVFEAMASAGYFTTELENAWWGALHASAAQDLHERFEARPLAAVELAKRAELHVARRLAESGRLQAALERGGPWWRLDSRLLVAMAQAARSAGPTSAVIAGELYRSALVALEGEVEDEECAALSLECRFELLALAREGGRWREFEFLARELLALWRSARVPERAWNDVLGGWSPRRGIDGPAELESACWQARARRALERGDTAGARRWAEKARGRAGYSASARNAQIKLEEAIASRE